jgi:hypothetical protein
MNSHRPKSQVTSKEQALNPEKDLKVPKREIFDRSDFPDFYTIKSLRAGDFRVKMKKIFTNM